MGLAHSHVESENLVSSPGVGKFHTHVKKRWKRIFHGFFFQKPWKILFRRFFTHGKDLFRRFFTHGKDLFRRFFKFFQIFFRFFITSLLEVQF